MKQNEIENFNRFLNNDMSKSKTKRRTARIPCNLTFFAGKTAKKSVMFMTITMLCMFGCGSKQKEQQSAEANNPQQEVPLQRIGTPAFGYVNIPANFKRFRDLNENVKDLQYSDLTSRTIISLNVFDKTGLPPEEAETLTANDAANHVAYNLEANGALHVEGYMDKISGNEAYQLHAIYTGGSQLVAWLFMADDGEVHYICVESDTEEKLWMLISLVRESFSFEETQ